MTAAGNPSQDVDIDLAQLFRAVWRRKGRLLAATVFVAGSAFVVASLMAPRYEAETRILIEPREPNLTSPGTARSDLQSVLDEQNVVSQVQLLTSTDLLRRVAKNMKLYERSEFDPETNPSPLADILVSLGLRNNPLEIQPEDRVLKTFLEHLQVYPVEKSRVIGIQFTSKDPQLAAGVPNEIAKVYRSLQSGAKLDNTSEAARWLEPEIANLREKVRAAEKKVADYRASSGLLRTSDTSDITTTQLNDITVELSKVRAERANAVATAQNVRAALKAGRSTETLDAVASSPVIQRLKEAEGNANAQLSDLQTTLLDSHPRLKALRAQIAGIRQQIASEAQKIAEGLENQAGLYQLREAQLDQQLNQAKAESARAGDDQVGLNALEREATAQRDLLETYLARYREASSRLDKDASPADARVISTAIAPTTASFPKVIPITIVAGVATLVLGSVIIMLAELFSGRALSPIARPAARREDEVVEIERTEPVEAPSAPPQPVVIGPARKKTEAVPAHLMVAEVDTRLAAAMERAVDADMLKASAADVVSNDRQALEEPAPEDDFSVSAVADYLAGCQAQIVFGISPTGDDGSTLTVMLARELGERGQKVLVIDMSGSGCPTALMAGSRDLPGITELLCGEAAFADVIHPDRLSSVDLIPQGRADVRQAMRGADRMSMIADALADVYDTVLVECGPADAQGVARLSHSGIHEIVLSAPEPDTSELAEIMTAFSKAGYDDLILMTGGTTPKRPRTRAA
ncbi:GumC family protein [Rhizobium halophytocola]|uniref:Exopolysaccharide transport family protein n=1 Tax=Rhizobium halophytocola TaxID=735519 RepID=A0ABS4DY92_9HYPH|nr:exopolysaccharide transport family protein [Rhizobium halophytocola]MBP1850664.1 exopolysaccharide transport family protein [Rhizobium halophytocola]